MSTVAKWRVLRVLPLLQGLSPNVFATGESNGSTEMTGRTVTMGQIHRAFARGEITVAQAAELTAELLTRVPWWLRIIHWILGC